MNILEIYNSRHGIPATEIIIKPLDRWEVKYPDGSIRYDFEHSALDQDEMMKVLRG